MKFFTLSIIVLLFWANTCQASVDTFIVKRFRHIIRLIESDNAKELSHLVSYPLHRDNPLPDIKNSQEFIFNFSILFDKSFKDLLKQYDDSDIFEHNGSYGLVGGSFTGQIWIGEDGKISAINYSSKQEKRKKEILTAQIKKEMYPTVNTWSTNILVAKSEKLLIRLDRTDKGVRYVCWGKGRTMKDAPDIILYDGVEEAQGTMGGWTWTFKKGDWAYIIDDEEMCGNDLTCGLFLDLLFKGERKSHMKLQEIK
jgi:hypothetical protein